ncbi:MAG: hypothetical protein ABL984_11990 [Pyrinomonadaceae bacterium]
MVPESERSPHLKSALRDFIQITVELLERDPYLRHEYQGNVFSVAHGMWIAAVTADVGDDYFEQQKARLQAAGFDGDRVDAKLNEILAADQHLVKCCGNATMLASYLGTAFINTAAESTIRSRVFDPEVFDAAFDDLTKQIYSEEFKTEMLCHVFNFESEIDEFLIGDIKVKRYSDAEIRLIFNNPTLKAVFHPEGTGNFFVSTEIEGDRRNPEAYSKAIDATHETLNNLVGVLQVAKDGMITQDYRFLRYSPQWVNRLYPTFPVGEAKRFPYAGGNRFYALRKDEFEKIETWAWIYGLGATQKRLEEHTNLGRQLLVSIEFYTSSFDQKDEAQRLIHLMVSLEALFNPDDHKQISRRIPLYASQLVGITKQERDEIFQTLRNTYKVRSNLVHGSIDIDSFYNDTLVSAVENEALASIIRRGILRLLALYLKGRNQLHANKSDSIHAGLEKAAASESIGDKIRTESDVDTFVQDFLKANAS